MGDNGDGDEDGWADVFVGIATGVLIFLLVCGVWGLK